MERHAIAARSGWQSRVEQQGLVFWQTERPDGSATSYWNEEAHYTLTHDEVYDLEAVARLLMQEMLVAAGDHVIEHELFHQLGIPGWAVPRVKETWEAEPPMLYGRFDFALGHDGVPKLLEYNADTPTCLVETAVQWHWLEEVFGGGAGGGADQWNRVHEALVERWRELDDDRRLHDGLVHLLHTGAERSGEDLLTVGYLAETAREAGLRAMVMPIESLGLLDGEGFVDELGRPVRTAFKLYPWEWMVHEPFAPAALERMGTGEGQTQWIEPIWKMLWSNKGILPILWRLFPGHPNLLPAYFAGEEHDLDAFVRKPLFAREGANASVVIDGEVVEQGPDQDYGAEGFVIQAYTDLGDYGGGRPVLGVWTVDMEPQGLGIRESDGLVTTDQSRFVPHVIV